jgi:hypothetical protein
MYTRLQLVLFAGLIALGLSFTATTANGQVKGKGKGAKKALQNVDHTSIIAELRQAKQLLDLGLHDYNGHRARADHEVHKAIHLLHHGQHFKGEYKSNFTAPLHTGPITDAMQAASDTKLRQAQKLINAAQLQLSNWHTKHGHAHHKDAAQFLSMASREIDLALVVVQNYHHHHRKAQAALIK